MTGLASNLFTGLGLSLILPIAILIILELLFMFTSGK